MSDVAVNTSGGPSDDVLEAKIIVEDPLQPKTRWEHWLDGISDWINPILVKESRQSLKSRQFLATFSLLLTCCWGWSLLGVAIRMPGIFYIPGGRFMLVGYYLILAIPLLIIIPFSAFRSLAAERDDGTFELLSISSLRPWQIITGKLGSAALQMLIMLSVLAPCMTFTYLLRGVDIVFVISILFYGAILCMLLSCVGLLLATLTKARHWQILISVGFILGLGFITFWLCFGGSAFIIQNLAVIPFREPEYWVAQACILSGIGCLCSLLLLSAAARISPRSENRSTRIRIALLVTHLVMFGWFSRYFLKFDEIGIGAAYVFVATVFWMIAGAMMTGEDALLSPRVLRGLPQTSLGRVFLTLFYPGPGTGYLFAIANMLAVVVGAVMFLVIGDFNFQSNHVEVFNFACITASYAIVYLGINRLVLRLVSRNTLTGPILGFLMGLVLIGFGALVPLTVQFSLSRYLSDPSDYTMIQLPNLFWTTAEVIGGNNYNEIFSLFHPMMIVVAAAAVVVFLLNLILLPSAVHARRVATPTRVLQEDAEKNPPPAAKPQRQNPWDD